MVTSEPKDRDPRIDTMVDVLESMTGKHYLFTILTPEGDGVQFNTYTNMTDYNLLYAIRALASDVAMSALSGEDHADN